MGAQFSLAFPHIRAVPSASGYQRGRVLYLLPCSPVAHEMVSMDTLISLHPRLGQALHHVWSMTHYPPILRLGKFRCIRRRRLYVYAVCLAVS